jgi:hypothetical protein
MMHPYVVISSRRSLMMTVSARLRSVAHQLVMIRRPDAAPSPRYPHLSGTVHSLAHHWCGHLVLLIAPPAPAYPQICNAFLQRKLGGSRASHVVASRGRANAPMPSLAGNLSATLLLLAFWKVQAGERRGWHRQPIHQPQAHGSSGIARLHLSSLDHIRHRRRAEGLHREH